MYLAENSQTYTYLFSSSFLNFIYFSLSLLRSRFYHLFPSLLLFLSLPLLLCVCVSVCVCACITFYSDANLLLIVYCNYFGGASSIVLYLWMGWKERQMVTQIFIELSHSCIRSDSTSIIISTSKWWFIDRQWIFDHSLGIWFCKFLNFGHICLLIAHSCEMISFVNPLFVIFVIYLLSS